MKNSSIFILLLVVLVASGILAATDRSRMATVVGRFSDCLGGVDYKWVYLYDESDGSGEVQALDSCLILDNGFTLRADVPCDSRDCRIVMPQIGYEAPVTLHPRRTLEANIAPEPFERIAERELRAALARLDSTGVSLPDSVWCGMQELDL